MTDSLKAGPNRQVTITFSLSLMDGQLIDRCDTPATFNWGDESLLPALEKAMLGLEAGAKRSLFVQAREAFGEVNPDNIQYFKPDQLADMQVTPDVGLLVSFNDDHRTNMGESDVSGVITSIDADWITIDFNHPLAGRDLNFQFEIHAVSMPEKGLGIPIQQSRA